MATMTTTELKAALLLEERLMQIAFEQNFTRQKMLFDALKPGASQFTKGVQMKEMALKYFPSITSQTIKTQTQIQHASATRSAGVLTELLGKKVDVPTLEELLKESNLSAESLEALARYSLDEVNFWQASNFATPATTAVNMTTAVDSLSAVSGLQAHYANVRATDKITSKSSGKFQRKRKLQPGACEFCVMLAGANNALSYHHSCVCGVIHVPIFD